MSHLQGWAALPSVHTKVVVCYYKGSSEGWFRVP